MQLLDFSGVTSPVLCRLMSGEKSRQAESESSHMNIKLYSDSYEYDS